MPTGVGLGFGLTFVGVGFYEVSVYAGYFPSPNAIIAVLLVGLGVGLSVLSLRSGLVNPVVRLKGDDAGLHFSRRWGREVSLGWSDPGFEIEVDDLAPDPESSPEDKRHLYFAATGSVYGNLAPAFGGPLLDAARAHGLGVRMSSTQLRTLGTRHKIRRIRIARRRTR